MPKPSPAGELNSVELENNLLSMWKEEGAFVSSITNREKGAPFIFLEGPPTANGKPGIHHVVARTYKDLVCRWKTMQGFRVERKGGWDTHGLPVEIEVQKVKSKDKNQKFNSGIFSKSNSPPPLKGENMIDGSDDAAKMFTEFDEERSNFFD